MIEQLRKFETKIELVMGERDFEKKKTEKHKTVIEELERELQIVKEIEII